MFQSKEYTAVEMMDLYSVSHNNVKLYMDSSL